MIRTEENISRQDAWFDDLMGEIRSHQIQIAAGVASEELRNQYGILMRGNDDEMAAYGKSTAQRHFVARILLKYISSIAKDFGISFLSKLAFSFNDSEILVWAEIPDEREDLERSLILTEAKVNEEFYKYGYSLSTMVVEESDNLEIPAHYNSVINHTSTHNDK